MVNSRNLSPVLLSLELLRVAAIESSSTLVEQQLHSSRGRRNWPVVGSLHLACMHACFCICGREYDVTDGRVLPIPAPFGATVVVVATKVPRELAGLSRDDDDSLCRLAPTFISRPSHGSLGRAIEVAI